MIRTAHGISCPACGHDDVAVRDSRAIEDAEGRVIARKRRYRCRGCDHRFVTIEVLAPKKERPS